MIIKYSSKHSTTVIPPTSVQGFIWVVKTRMASIKLLLMIWSLCLLISENFAESDKKIIRSSQYSIVPELPEDRAIDTILNTRRIKYRKRNLYYPSSHSNSWLTRTPLSSKKKDSKIKIKNNGTTGLHKLRKPVNGYMKRRPGGVSIGFPMDPFYDILMERLNQKLKRQHLSSTKENTETEFDNHGETGDININIKKLLQKLRKQVRDYIVKNEKSYMKRRPKQKRKPKPSRPKTCKSCSEGRNYYGSVSNSVSIEIDMPPFPGGSENDNEQSHEDS